MEERNVYTIAKCQKSIGHFITSNEVAKELENQLICSFGIRKSFDSNCINTAIETIFRHKNNRRRIAANSGMYHISANEIIIDQFLIRVKERIELGEQLYYSNLKIVADIDFKMRFLDEVVKKRST